MRIRSHLNQPQDRRNGALLGLAVGDALGTTLEFSRPKPLPWLPPLRGPHVAVTGGGPFLLTPGQVTDDTEMAICLSRVLAAHGHAPPTRSALIALADAYVAWREVAFDIGGQTASALRAYASGRDPAACGLQVWQTGGSTAAGNGSLMRTAPIGALVSDADSRRRWAIADALITHADPRCILAGVAFNEAIASGVLGGDAVAMTDAALSALTPGLALASTFVDLGPGAQGRWAEAEADLRADLEAAACTDPWLNDEAQVPAIWPTSLQQSAATQADRYRLGVTGNRAGFVRVAFRLAFYQLMHAHGWPAALIDTVNRGGDADTNGAIVGALLGARFGATCIPAAWAHLVRTCDPPAPWDRAGLYHPQAMLAVDTGPCGLKSTGRG